MEDEEAMLAALDRHLSCVNAGQRCGLAADGEPCLYCGDDDDDDDDDDWEDFGEASDEEEERRRRRRRRRRGQPATFCGFRKAFLCQASASAAAPTPPAAGARAERECPLLGLALPQKQQVTAEEAERNAEELVAEEARLKNKAEKKKLKKKRQKDRKRQEKLMQELKAKKKAQLETAPHRQGTPDEDSPAGLTPGDPDSDGSLSQAPSELLASPGRCSSRSTEGETEEEFDLRSTFVSKARLKVDSKPPPPPKKEKAARPEGKDPEGKEQQQVPRPVLQMPSLEHSLVLADYGNETAKRGCYQEAISLFTEAIKLNPREYRFFGNRSFCYERLQCFAEALCDAQLALLLQPGWPKGLFRQGKALMGLKRYTEAARTFEELLLVDGFRGDAAIQLKKCRVQLLLENSFSRMNPGMWTALAREPWVPLPGEHQGSRCVPSSSPSQASRHLASVTITNSQCQVPPPSAAQNSFREWFAIWVGNLTPKVTEQILLYYFEPFGTIDSIRRLPRKFCAFVNYTRKEAAEAAYLALQGVEVEGSKLLLQLKHPVHATPPHTKAAAGTQHPPLK